MDREKKDQQLHNTDAIAAKYYKKHNIPSSSFIRKNRILKAIQPLLLKNKTLGHVVDIGCGIGSMAKYLDGKYESYLGIDYSDALINTAKNFNRDNNKAKFISENIKTGQIPDNCADVILALGVLHHMTELDRIMMKLKKIAKPGAIFIAIEPIDVNPIVQLLRWVRGKVDSSYSEEQHFFSSKELKELMTKNKLEDVSLEYVGLFTKPFTEVIFSPQFIIKPLSRIFVALDNVIQAFCPFILRFLAWDIIVKAKFPRL